MNKLGLAKLLVLAAVLTFSDCGGAAEKAGGDTKAAGAPKGANAAGPTPATDGGANVVATPAAAPTPPASAGEPGTSPSPESRRAGSAPPAKLPTPQIGSGGNDLFLFTQARAAINNDGDLKAANVVIEVREGVVTLTGTVTSAALKSKAEQLARGAGVKDVRNQPRVSAGR